MFSSVIVDASIAVKWFSEEIDTLKAEEYFTAILEHNIKAFAPSLIFYEVGNALFKGKNQDRVRIEKSLKVLMGLPIEIMAFDASFADLAVGFMLQYNLSFYDAIYAGLAALLDLPLLTANLKHHGKVKEIKIFSLK